jgi:acyl-CoA thioesterase-1
MVMMRLLIVFLLFVSAGCDGGSDGDSIEYAALGASDVVGIGATPLTNGYVYLVADGIEQQRNEGVDLNNLGIPGATVATIREAAVEILKRSSTPSLITLSTGANDVIAGDSPASFEQDLSQLLDDLRAIAPQATIAIANVPNLTEVPRFVEEPDRDVTISRLRSFNSAIARQAKAYNALLVDLYSVPVNDALVNDVDGFHPSDAGHRAIANQFLAVIAPYIPSLS